MVHNPGGDEPASWVGGGSSSLYPYTYTWMCQEVSKRLVSADYTPNIPIFLSR